MSFLPDIFLNFSKRVAFSCSTAIRPLSDRFAMNSSLRSSIRSSVILHVNVSRALACMYDSMRRVRLTIVSYSLAWLVVEIGKRMVVRTFGQ